MKFEERTPFQRIIQYAIAAVGPIGTAGSQLALSIALLKVLSKHEFGTVSFLLVLSAMSWGVCSALFCTPLQVILHNGTLEERTRGEQAILAGNFYGSMLAGMLGVGLGFALGLPVSAAVLFGCYTCVALLRWFGRAYAYARGLPLRATASDLLYCGSLVVGIALLLLADTHLLTPVYGILLLSAMAGVFPFAQQLRRQLFSKPSAIRHYGEIWQQKGRWTLIGMITTEATSNAHAYLVTLILGPTAFAPVAASAITARPTAVAINALGDFEQPIMTRHVAQHRFDEVARSISNLRFVLGAIWIGTAVAILAVFHWAPHLLFPKHYDIKFLERGAILWMLVAAFRMARLPESAVLIACGAFKTLAQASLWSSVVTVSCVALLVLYAGALWSIVGLLVGQAVFAFWTIYFAKRQLSKVRDLHLKPAPAGPQTMAENIAHASRS